MLSAEYYLQRIAAALSGELEHDGNMLSAEHYLNRIWTLINSGGDGGDGGSVAAVIGQIAMYAGITAPAGWALCQGQTLSIAEFPQLYDVIGTTYGGDGVYTFMLPNMSSRIPIGVGQGADLSEYVLGAMGGQEVYDLEEWMLPSHTHGAEVSVWAYASGGGSSYPENNVWAGAETAGEMMYSANAPDVPMQNGIVEVSITPTDSPTEPVNVIQPYIAINYIIALTSDGTGEVVEIPWYNVWGKTCLAAYQPMLCDELEISYSNVANPGTYDAIPGSGSYDGPDLVVGHGWEFNGSSEYVNTGVIATETTTMLIRYTNADGFADILAGVIYNGNNYYITLQQSFDQIRFYWGDFQTITGPHQTGGVLGLSGPSGYLDGYMLETDIGVWINDGGEIYVGAINNSASPTFGDSGEFRIQLIAIYDDILDDAEMLEISTTMANVTFPA